jgi:DNA-binding protein HU-beta
MNKQELIDVVSTSSSLSKADATRALDATLDHISKVLSKGEAVILIGFGTFDVAQRAARAGRNPQTGATIQIPAAKAVRFKPGKALKEQVNK